MCVIFVFSLFQWFQIRKPHEIEDFTEKSKENILHLLKINILTASLAFRYITLKP